MKGPLIGHSANQFVNATPVLRRSRSSMKNAAVLMINSHFVAGGSWGMRAILSDETRKRTVFRKGSEQLLVGAGGRNRTGTVLPPADFEAASSYYFGNPGGGKRMASGR